jgi:undecaprenyl-diphosphatase
VPWLFGWSDFDSAATEKAFDTALHLGTLVAVLIYLRADLFLYIRQGSQIIFRPKQPLTAVGRRAWLLVLSAVPAGIVGAAFEDKITEKLGSPALISVSLIVFGLVLIWADRRATFKNSSESAESLTTRDALVIGLAQVLALNPGTSRSGITITAARLSGYSREAAARLSFLMSVPIISGAVVFSVAKLMRDGVPDGLLVPMIVGIVTAAISGFLAMSSMIRLVQTKTFAPYVVYRCVIGAGVLIALATSWR